MFATSAPPDPLTAVPPPAELRRQLADLTRRRTLLQALLRVSLRIASYPPPVDDRPPAMTGLNPVSV